MFAGSPHQGFESRLIAALESTEYFIAEQVRVPDRFFDDGPDEQEDHCWREYDRLEATDGEPSDGFSRSIEGFIAECEAAARLGWRIFDASSRKPNLGRPNRESCERRTKDEPA